MSGPKRYFVSPIPYENGMLYELPNIICVDEWPGITFYTYVRERTCRVVRKTVDVDGERMTDYTCCFNQPGWNNNFCPNCGARVEEEA